MRVKLKESQLTDIIREALDERNGIKTVISEGLTKSDEDVVKSIVKKEIKSLIGASSSQDFEKKIEKMVKDKVKGDKDVEKYVVDITRDVLVQLYKTMWMQRNFWTSTLTNAKV